MYMQFLPWWCVMLKHLPAIFFRWVMLSHVHVNSSLMVIKANSASSNFLFSLLWQHHWESAQTHFHLCVYGNAESTSVIDTKASSDFFLASKLLRFYLGSWLLLFQYSTQTAHSSSSIWSSSFGSTSPLVQFHQVCLLQKEFANGGKE